MTNSPLKPWVQLPDIKPSQIRNSRRIRQSFTGDINNKIYTNPFFFDSEKIYLRAQIARISASTTLVPAGLYRFQEESTRDIEENAPEEGDIVKPTTSEMTNISKWLHFNPGILKQGRTKHADPTPGPGDEEVDPEDLMKREIEKDPWDERLKPIDQDSCTKGNMPAWVLRSYHTNTDQVDPKTGKVTVNNGTVVVKSMWWPGAVTLYNN